MKPPIDCVFVTEDGYRLEQRRGLWNDGDHLFDSCIIDGGPVDCWGIPLKGHYESTEEIEVCSVGLTVATSEECNCSKCK